MQIFYLTLLPPHFFPLHSGLVLHDAPLSLPHRLSVQRHIGGRESFPISHPVPEQRGRSPPATCPHHGGVLLSSGPGDETASHLWTGLLLLSHNALRPLGQVTISPNGTKSPRRPRWDATLLFLKQTLTPPTFKSSTSYPPSLPTLPSSLP